MRLFLFEYDHFSNISCFVLFLFYFLNAIYNESYYKCQFSTLSATLLFYLYFVEIGNNGLLIRYYCMLEIKVEQYLSKLKTI